MEDGGVCVETNHVKGQEEPTVVAATLVDDEPAAVKKAEENEVSPSAVVDVDEKPVIESDSKEPHQQQVDLKDDVIMVQAESSSPVATEEPTVENGVDCLKQDEKVKGDEGEKEKKEENNEEVKEPVAVLPKEEVKEKPKEKPSVQKAKENGISEQIVRKADDKPVVLVADLNKSTVDYINPKGDEEEEEDDLVMEQEPVELIEEHPESPSAKVQQQEQPEDEEPAEEQPSSTCSSPSALHIHLDEEDKGDPPMSVSVASVKDKRVDPSMPLISNVVSLSSVASSPNGPSPTPSVGSNGGGSVGGGSNNTRRTTLRFKRGIEISFDVDQNGQPVTVTNPQSGASANPQSEAGTSGEPNQKRGRLDHHEEEEEDHHQVSEMDSDTTNVVLIGVQKDIRTLRFMAKQKEKEWNYILKLMKAKEEMQAKLMRRREVLKISTGSGRKSHLPTIAQQQTIAAASTASSQQQNSSQQVHHQQQQLQTQANLQSFINQSLNNLMAANKSVLSSASKSQMSASSAAMNLLQQQQQLQQQQLQQQQSKMHQRQRPILPKPDIQVWNQQQQQQHHHHHHQNHSSLADSGFGSSQETLDARNRTISVQSLIADHRSKHPEEIPTRGRRIRQPSRICNDPNSSSSPPPNSQSSSLEPNANMSFKDVLLQFAKMSSRQGHSASELLGQLSSKELNNSISGSSGMTGNSSAAALQNLAAARNARTASPHATALTAGSILQNALSGSRTNPSFAPTLAQLLTNPANEHQQQQQHTVNQVMAHHQPTVTIPTSATAATSSSAEVLTLSNLLATAKGHVTITSDRDNDDVTVVGGSSSSSSSGRNANSNYLRTSGGSEVPKCQGCNERTAQFVCAGCSSQWYCSRECQVAAWEEHSEHCVG